MTGLLSNATDSVHVSDELRGGDDHIIEVHWRLSVLPVQGRDAFAFRSLTSRRGPPKPCRAEAFWNSRCHALLSVVPWSVPAFLFGSARRTPRFSGHVRETAKASRTVV